MFLLIPVWEIKSFLSPNRPIPARFCLPCYSLCFVPRYQAIDVFPGCPQVKQVLTNF